MLFSILSVFGYVPTRAIQRGSLRPTRTFLILWITIYLTVFYVTKQYTFLGWLGWPEPWVPYPIKAVGLSYVMFRQIGAMLEASGGTLSPITPLAYFNYLFSFLTLLSGPIQRYNDFHSQTAGSPASTYRSEPDRLAVLHRLANGLIKSVVLASLVEPSSRLFDLSREAGGIWPAIFDFYAPVLYVFFSFSGYCDMMIAIARWGGLSIPENFRRPFLSRNPTELWQRWHITLSEWLRDFVFNPLYLGLLRSRVAGLGSLSLAVAAIVVTFTVMGIWHGASSGFVVFGLLHAGGVGLHRIYEGMLKRWLSREWLSAYRRNRAIRFASVLACSHFLALTFLFFGREVGESLRIIRMIWTEVGAALP